MTSKMPKIETLRKHFPDCGLEDHQLLEIAEWLRDHLKQEHISVNNKSLANLIAWEDRNK